jgi:RNA polymerase sigma-70 factor, ECF subfamily
MNRHDWLAEQFEEHRAHMRAVAYRMLGSLSEADDAVQESWLRLSRADTNDVENLRGWLTTVVARVCLTMLRSRKRRHEEMLGSQLPEPISSGENGADPEHEALLAGAVGPALLLVLDTLAPSERVAFVLHDVFAVPFDEIAPIVGRSTDAARQLASRARRRVQGNSVPETDVARQRQVVDAFLAAARDGDLNALVAVLDPDVVLRADRAAVPAGPPREVHGARAVARGALTFAERARFAQPALVNGAAGVVAAPRGRLFVVLSFTITGGKIVEIDVIADPDRVRQLDLAVLDRR